MLKQLYTPEQIAKVIRRRDVWRWDLWEKESEREECIYEFSNEISGDSFAVSELRTCLINGHAVHEPSRAEDFLAIRLVDHYLRRIYKVRQSDRSRIIRQLKVVLEDSGDLELRKLDIRSFYESIDFDGLIDKIRADMILGYKGIRILESLSTRAKKVGAEGLPRGIGVSATLAELVGREIDRHISNTEGVYYAARYVDDIIIIADRRRGDRVEESLRALWTHMGLEANQDKGVTKSLDCMPRFCYLGYEFAVGKARKHDKPREVAVRIAPAKIRKQKTKICKAFWQFTQDGSFSTLLARLRYLSGNLLIASSENGTLYAGNSFNYREISDASSLDTLDGLLRQIISGKGRLGRSVAHHLSPVEVQLLKRISFRRAFEERLRFQFTRCRSQRLKRVFRNV